VSIDCPAQHSQSHFYPRAVKLTDYKKLEKEVWLYSEPKLDSRKGISYSCPCAQSYHYVIFMYIKRQLTNRNCQQ